MDIPQSSAGLDAAVQNGPRLPYLHLTEMVCIAEDTGAQYKNMFAWHGRFPADALTEPAIKYLKTGARLVV